MGFFMILRGKTIFHTFCSKIPNATLHGLIYIALFAYSILGQSEPNVDISALPSLSIPVLGEIEIKCDANAANPALPPITIMIHVGPYLVKECANAWEPVNECRFKLGPFFPNMPKEISCTAVNAKGECRLDNAQVVLLSGTG